MAADEGSEFVFDGPSRTFAKSQTHLYIFSVRFWAFPGKGSKKTPYKYFCKKSMSKTFPKKIDKNSMSVFFPTFYGLSRFWVFLGDVSSKTPQQIAKFLPKNG
jgi:hypothetical protein